MTPLLLAAGSEVVSWQVTLFQQLLNGLTFGSLIALIALGYTMVYGIIGLINFAHGDLFMLGGFLAWSLAGWMDLEHQGSFGRAEGIVVLLVIVPLFCAGLNWSVERIVYRPLRNAPKLAPLVSAIGVSFVFMNIGEFWGGESDRNFPALVSQRNLLGEHSAYYLSGESLMVIAVVVPLMIGLTLLVKRTQLGRAMRATSQNAVAAQLMGINVDRVIGSAFLIGGGLAGVASVIYGLYIHSVHFQMGYKNGLYAFTAAVLGGIGNIPGAVLGGLLIGLISALSRGYISEHWADAVIFAILILILIFKPSGLLGTREGEGMTAVDATPHKATPHSAKPVQPSTWDHVMRRWGPEGCALGVLLVLPWLPLDRITDLMIFALLALGLNVVVGYTGLLHLGIAAFFGIGAYIAGVLTVPAFPFQVGFATALVCSTLGAALFGLVLGAPTLRLRGDYLALVTLGFGEIVSVSLRNLEAITAGTRALGPIPPLSPSEDANKLAFYYLAAALLAGVVLLLRSLEQSRLGRAWIALREDELAATCMGINAPRVKLSAFALSAGLAGMAGCLYATKLGNTASPDAYGFNVSITVLCCVILGGLASIRGVLVGVLLLKGYEYVLAPQLDQWAQSFKASVVEWLRANDRESLVDKTQTLLTFSNWKLLIFGLVLIIIMRFRPEGLIPSRRVQHELESRQ